MTKENRHTSLYLTNLVSALIDEINPAKVFGICTDNAANMTATWKALSEVERFQHISFYGCAAHVLNLLVGDIMNVNSAKFIINQATKIAKHFRNKQVWCYLYTILTSLYLFYFH